jgi:hypothetical protein
MLLVLALSLSAAGVINNSEHFSPKALSSPEGNWELEYALIEGERAVFEQELFGLADEICLKSSRWYFRESPKKQGSIVLSPNPMCSEGEQDFTWRLKKGPNKSKILQLEMKVGKKEKAYPFEILASSSETALQLLYKRGKAEKGNNLILSLRKH